MKKLLTLLLTVLALTATAQEKISILSPYAASHSGTPAMFKVLEQANSAQNKYHFILEFKPGGEQLIAVKAIEQDPQRQLAIIAPKFVEHVSSGKLKLNDYVPVHALGDACWAVISNINNGRSGIANLQGQREIFVGGVGIGNAAHLTSLQIGERYGFAVKYIPFKSNYDALVLMASDGSINFVVDRVAAFQQMHTKNPNIAMLAISCPERHPQAPNVPTLKEQGILAPYVFNITVAHTDMKADRRQELAQILQDATAKVGAETLQQVSDMRPPAVPVEQYYRDSINFVDRLLKKHKNSIDQK